MMVLRKNGYWHFVSRKIIHGENADCVFVCQQIESDSLVSFERFQREDFYA